MARFPESEEEVVALARKIVQGLSTHPSAFPQRPVSAEELEAAVGDFLEAREAAADAAAAAQTAHGAKDAALHVLEDHMKMTLRHAEYSTRFSDSKLRLLGWGARQRHKPPKPPGQARDLRVLRQGEGPPCDTIAGEA